MMKLIDQAVAAHRSGNLTDAKSLYRKILATDKGDFDALHSLVGALITLPFGEKL
jgi:hypothetical protein